MKAVQLPKSINPVKTDPIIWLFRDFDMLLMVHLQLAPAFIVASMLPFMVVLILDKAR